SSTGDKPITPLPVPPAAAIVQELGTRECVCEREERFVGAMAPPKRQLALTGAGAGREEAKRLRVGVAKANAAGWRAPTSPASPGTRLMRRTVLVVLFLLRMSDGITVTESISQIGRMGSEEDGRDSEGSGSYDAVRIISLLCSCVQIFVSKDMAAVSHYYLLATV
uniref:Uncharacterized protein n=1 Tax=Aegilops tauschii subsp. strangulata TaxID=200361 RepID=A0A453JZC5_AEGTS